MTSAVGFEALAPLRDDPERAAILLDIDGTLAPIVEQPSAAQVPPETREILMAIADRYGTVACVSGRRASEARAMVAIERITYLGSHGAELLAPGWSEPQLDRRLEDWAARMHDFAREADTPEVRQLGVRLEDKGAILAFHWRAAADEEAARTAIDAMATRAQGAGLRPHWGRKVLEVRPPVQFDKGAGVAALLDGLDIDAAMYVGDDVTDLDAFQAIAELAREGRIRHAIRVGVQSEEGPEEIVEEADLVVQGTSGVRVLLSALVR